MCKTSRLARTMKKEQKLHEQIKKSEEDTGLIIYEKNGKHRRKAKPEEVPKRLVNGEGVSAENGIPVRPKIDARIRREKR